MTLRQNKVVDVLQSAPFPLMMAQDIASILNEDGSLTHATKVGGSLTGLRKQGIVSKRIIYGGCFDLQQMRWVRYHTFAGRGLRIWQYRPRKTYWFLTSRANEVYPLGAERLQQRDERR